jgi:integrase
MCTIGSAPHSLKLERHVGECQGVGLCGNESRTWRTSSKDENYSAKNHVRAFTGCKDSRTIVLLDAVTGMRASELFALQWSDVDFERRLLFIRRTYYRGEFGLPKNENSERVIPLSPGLAAALQYHRQHVQRSSMDLAFPNARGKPYEPNNLVKRVLHPVLGALGLTKTGWRAFRRSIATALSEMREPVRTAQHILGHSSAQTTLAYYVQSVEESRRSAITRLEKIMFPSSRKARS